MPKKKLAIYTATGCPACENTLLDINYDMVSLTSNTDIIFWPYLQGSEWEALDEYGPVDLCILAGAVRTEADRNAVIRLRSCSRLMLAIGSCACFGGLPALCDLSSDMAGALGADNDILGKYLLPRMEPTVCAPSQIVNIDYFTPGCPPTRDLLWSAIQALLSLGANTPKIAFAASRLPQAIADSVTAGILPRPGSIFAGEKAVCASCSRTKEEKKFDAFYRTHQIDPASGRCLLEQGILCQGLATREGCGGICTAAGAPCRGCFGRTEKVFDPGAKMVSAVSSTFSSTDPKELKTIAESFVDLAGTFYRYTLATQCALMAPNSEDSNNAPDNS